MLKLAKAMVCIPMCSCAHANILPNCLNFVKCCNVSIYETGYSVLKRILVEKQPNTTAVTVLKIKSACCAMAAGKPLHLLYWYLYDAQPEFGVLLVPDAVDV